jgi:hypothetical protein
VIAGCTCPWAPEKPAPGIVRWHRLASDLACELHGPQGTFTIARCRIVHGKAAPRQSMLEALLCMAYNCGRDHEKTKVFGLEAGRDTLVRALSALVQNVDPGDLAKPATDLLRLLAEG